MQTKQDLLGLAHAELLAEDEQSVTIRVPNRKEELTVVVTRDVLTLLEKQEGLLQRMVKTLVSRNQKSIKKETININRRNYRIFI